MDFQSMKRKQLQALCKKHSIPANLTNLEMAKNLASLLKEKEKPMVRGRSCLKDMGETFSKNDSKRQFKKVRFSPENETIEFVDSRAARRRKSITKPMTQKWGLVISSIDSIEVSNGIVENQVRITRSRAQKLVSAGAIEVVAPVVEKKRKRMNGERSDTVEGDDGVRGNKTHLISDLSDHLASESTDAEEIRVQTKRPLRNREIPISKKTEEVEKDCKDLKKNQNSLKQKNVETNDKISKDTGLEGERKIVQPEKTLRRSKRRVRNVEDCGQLSRASVENEMAGRGRKARSKTPLVDNASALESEIRTETKVEAHGKPEVVVQLERSRGRNSARRKSVMPQIEEVENNGHKVENESRKQLRKSVLEGETRSEKLEGNDMRSRRTTRNKSISDGLDLNGNQNRKNGPRKRNRDPILEETVLTGTLGEEPPPRRSTRNGTKTDTAVQNKKLPSRLNFPNLEKLEPLAKSNAFKVPPVLDAEVSKPEITESAVLNSSKPPSISAANDMKEFGEKSLSKEVSVETFAIKEVIPPDMANLVEIGASKSVGLKTDYAETEPLVSVSDCVDEKKPPEDDTSTNEDDLESHSCKSTELESSILVEPEEDLNVPIDVGFPQVTVGADGYLVIDLTDCMALPSENSDSWKETERDEERAIRQCIDPSCSVAHHGVDGDQASAVKEQNLLEHKDSDNVAEAIEPESVVDDHLAESNESESTSVADLYNRERIGPTNMEDRDTDEAEKSAAGAAEQEPVICILRTQNNEMEPLFTKSISACKGLSVTYGLSELEVADGTSNSTLSSSSKLSAYTNVRGKGSGRNSSLKKQHHLIEACTGSADFDDIRGLMMVNSEKITPASNSLKLQCDSAEQEVQIPATETLVVTEKENIVLVAGNQYLLQGGMHHGNKYDLVSQSQMKIGGFDDQDDIPNADVNGTTFRAVGFSPLLQAEHVVKPSSMLTLGGHLEAEKLVSGIYTQSGGFTKADYAAEDDKIHVLEVQNIIEFQGDCRFSRQNKQSTQKRVCEGHSTGPGESESSGEDCAITFKNAAKMRMSAPLHGERISPNMVERNNNEAELVENISSSNVETAKVVPEEITNFQTTSSYCTPLNSPECEESHFTRPALTIAEGHTNLLEVEERSKYGNQFHQGIMSDSNTSKSNTKDKMCRQKKSVALADNETMSEGPLCVERASRPVNDETGYEHLEGNSLFEGHVSSLNELDDLLTGENENVGSETDSTHHYKNIEEPSMSILTNEKRILIWVERNTDQTRDTLAPIRGPESSVLVNNETSSECTPLKDENETGQEFKTLFATPANSASPCDDAASSHETEMSDARIQESSPICTVKNRRLNHVEPGNFLGLTENKDENMAYERNVSQTSSKEVASEGSDGSADVEFTGVDCSSYSAFDLFTSNDVHVDDKESDGSRNCGNASKEDRSVEVLPLRVGAGIDPIMLEKETDQTEYSKEAGDIQEYIAKSHTTQSGLEYHAFGASAKELSVGVLRLSGDIEMQDEGMRSSPDDLENVPVIQSATVTKVNNHDTSIKGDLNVEYSKLVTKKKDAENFPRVEIWDSNSCKDLVPQVNGRSHAGSAETPCKESKVSEEKITAGFVKCTSKSVSGTKVLKEGEKESVLAPFGQLGIGKVVLDLGVEYATSDAKGADASGISSDKDAKRNVILDGTKAALDHKDSDSFLMENRERVMHNNDELNVDKNEVVAELEKRNSDALLKLANRKEDEHILEVPNELAGTKLQVKEMKLHDVHCHKNCAIMEGDLDVIDSNSYAEEDVSPGCSDNCWEHEKILGKAGCSELNVSDNDGQGSQYHVSQRDLSSDAERREVTEIDEVDLFDDFGFTVSSCVPINCKEYRGNTPSSMDKSFQEDKDEGKEKKVGEISNHFAVCAIDDSNVEEYIKCEGKVSKEQLVCSEDALAGYHGTMRYGALELSLESTMFSSWEINLFLGDEVRNSEISVTDFTREDSDVASLSRENANVILPEEQFGRHNQLMEENVREPKSSCYVSEEATFEGDEVSEEKDSANKCIGCSYSEKGVVEVEKSMIPIDDGILRKASNFEGCASVDMRVEEGGFKSWEGEAATELCENAIKYNPAMEFQPSRYDLAVDGGTASAEDSQQIWEPRSELLRKEGSSNSAIKLLNSTTIKRKNADLTSWIQGTPLKKLMKENEPSIKRQNLGGTTVRSMTNRRALEDLQNH